MGLRQKHGRADESKNAHSGEKKEHLSTAASKRYQRKSRRYSSLRHTRSNSREVGPESQLIRPRNLERGFRRILAATEHARMGTSGAAPRKRKWGFLPVRVGVLLRGPEI